RSVSSPRRRSAIRAAVNIKGNANTVSRTCSDNTSSATDNFANGPRPCIAFHAEINATANIDALRPPAANRSAAQRRSGKGAQLNAGLLPAPFSALNTNKLTVTIPTASTPASKYRAGFTLRNQEIPFTPRITMVGTMTRLEIMLVVRRAVHNVQ